MTIHPTGDRLLVEIQPRPEENSLIVRPDVDEQQPQRLERGKVLAVGPGAYTAKGAFIEPTVRHGDTVLFQACMAEAIVGLEPGRYRVARECEPGDRVLVEEHFVLATEDDE